jgi:putative FmdB family regulatory protein
VPIYEFACAQCGARFEELVAADTKAATCPECGAEDARRVYSPQAGMPKLVKTPSENRKQERRNAELMKSAKARFKERRAQVNQARSRKRER